MENEFEMVIERQAAKFVSNFRLFNQASLPLDLLFCIFRKHGSYCKLIKRRTKQCESKLYLFLWNKNSKLYV